MAEIDHHAATELKLYLENDSRIYNSQTVPIMKNLMTKMARGVYSKSKAETMWKYLVDRAAKDYAREFSVGSDWSQMFSVPTRNLVAKQLAREFEDAVKIGEYDGMIGQWVPKKYQGEFITGKTARMANPRGRRLSNPRGRGSVHPNRYEVRGIAGTSGLEGPLIATYATYPAAKRRAENESGDYHYGTVVYDSQTGRGDFGSGWEEID